MIKKYLLFRDPGGLGENGGGTILVETTLVGQATDAEIQAWKVKYKQGIYQIEDEGHVAYFQNPTRQIMNASMSKASTEASLDMYELCAKLCFIGGSDQVMKDEQGFFTPSKS